MAAIMAWLPFFSHCARISLCLHFHLRDPHHFAYGINAARWRLHKRAFGGQQTTASSSRSRALSQRIRISSHGGVWRRASCAGSYGMARGGDGGTNENGRGVA